MPIMDEHNATVSIKQLQQQNSALVAENTYLKQELSQLRRMIFGQKRERFLPGDSDTQIGLNLGDTAPEMDTRVEEISYQRKKVSVKPAPHGRNELPAHLVRRDMIIEPDEDTATLVKIGEEITEELDYEPGSLFVRRYIRPKYARADGNGVVIGPLPSRPVEKGIAGAGLLAHVAISKHLDHLPLYRQRQQFKRQGVDLSASTLGDWIKSTCDLLMPIYRLHKEILLMRFYLMADETPIRVLDRHRKGQSHTGYYWVYYDPLNQESLFDYRRSRSRAGPNEMLSNFCGYLQVDGYNGYNETGRREGITLLGCMAHARRYFEKALPNDRERAAWMLEEIRLLYMIERFARNQRLSYQERLALRRENALPIMTEMRAWLDREKLQVLPKSLLGKAIGYMLTFWDRLLLYLEDGRFEIDNNLVENAIRPVALGRKNYLFAGSHDGAERAAILYSLISTAKLHGHDPYQYLKDVISRIADHPHKRLEALLPANWGK